MSTGRSWGPRRSAELRARTTGSKARLTAGGARSAAVKLIPAHAGQEDRLAPASSARKDTASMEPPRHADHAKNSEI